MKKLFTAIILGLTLSFSAFASSSVDNTTITRVMIDQNYGSIIYVQVAGTLSNSPSCLTNNTWQYAFDASTTFGKLMFSQVLAAYNSIKTVKIEGAGTCNNFSTVEDMRRIELK